MKIYRLPVADTIRPATGFIAPAHNADYGVEQDFEQWLLARPDLLTDDPAAADFDYLPAFWNRFYTAHWGDHSDRLQAEIERLVNRSRPAFTICEYDVISMQPHIDLCNMTVFTASRHGDNGGIDIPLLCSAHRNLPIGPPHWLASFMGKFETHPLREGMRQALAGRADVYLSESRDTAAYTRLMAQSLVALAPRGYGGQSFRFYEAMQFGCVPFLISDVDTRPFKQWIDWDECSLYTDDPAQIGPILDGLDEGELRYMGRVAKKLWQEEIHYGKWCKYVLDELDRLR